MNAIRVNAESSGVIRAAGPFATKSHDAYHNFFSRSAWNMDALWEALFLLLVAALCTTADGTCGRIWIAGDDTHGHVDDLCRFVGHHTVVLCQEKNSTDANYVPLQENWERLEDMRAEDGTRLEVVALPMPAPVVFDGQRLPASYANFYFANSAVLVPTFNDPNDRIALGILSDLITDRPVIGIHAEADDEFAIARVD